MPCVTVHKLLESVLVRSIHSNELKQSTANNWEKKITKNAESREGQFTKLGRPNQNNEEVMLKIKEVIIGIRLAGAVISRKTVMSIGIGVLKANNPNSLS